MPKFETGRLTTPLRPHERRGFGGERLFPLRGMRGPCPFPAAFSAPSLVLLFPGTGDINRASDRQQETLRAPAPGRSADRRPDRCLRGVEARVLRAGQPA